jgi:hypothetical protein
MGRGQALRRDRLDELVHRLLRAFRLRPADGQDADGANCENVTSFLEHSSLPILPVRPGAPTGRILETGVRDDVLTITKRSKAQDLAVGRADRHGQRLELQERLNVIKSAALVLIPQGARRGRWAPRLFLRGGALP